MEASPERAFGELRNLDALSEVCLNSNNIDDEGCRLLASSPWWTTLRTLELHQSSIGEQGLEALLDGLEACTLHYVDLSNKYAAGSMGIVDDLMHYNTIGPRGAALLAASPHLGALSSLQLDLNPIGDEGARALASSPYLSGLKQLSLNSAQIGTAGVQALAGSPRLKGLTKLSLRGNTVDTAAATALAMSPHLAALEELTLGHLSEDCGAILANSPYLAQPIRDRWRPDRIRARAKHL